MALKFVSTPVKRRQGIQETCETWPHRQGQASRHLEEYAAIDQFGDLPARKRQASIQARKLGHDLLPWHERPNDPAGRYNAFCASCNRLVVVCTETPEGFTDIYGKALIEDCVLTGGM